MGIFSTKPLDKEIRFERKVADDAFDSAGSETWEEVATVRANVEELRVSRSERMAQVVNIAAQPARILIRMRDDIDSSMRIIHGSRILEIVAGPIELGRREALELMTQNYFTSGNAA
jgi:SPP1 family predicted phage head-tail adaptor